MGNKPPKGQKTRGDVPDSAPIKSKKGSKKSKEDKKEKSSSQPDLAGAVPYRNTDDDSKVTVTIYRSLRDVRRHPSEIQPSRHDVNVRILRKSTSGAAEKPSTLPRNFMRSKSSTLPGGRGALTPGENHYQEFPSLRRRIDSVGSRKLNQRSSSRNSMERTSKFVVPVTVTDLPATDVVKARISKFESLFVKSLVQKYMELPEDLQLQHLTVAFDSDPRGQPMSLFDYLNNDSLLAYDLSKPGGGQGKFINAIPEAMMHGTEHVRRTKVKSLSNQLPLVSDLLPCVALEAAEELSRMYEYQLSLMYDDIAMRILAGQAADCVIEYAKGHCLDRNTMCRSVAFVYPPNTDGTPKVMSAVIGLKELKWDLFEIFKKPGLRKEKSLTTKEYPRELDVDLDPWSFHYQKISEPFLYGYRGHLVEWDFHARVYKIYEQENTLFREEIAFQEEDIHRLYKPYKRLFGAELMERFCAESKLRRANMALDENNDTHKLKEVLKMKSFGNFTEIDDVMPVYRPLKPHSPDMDLGSIDTSGIDMRRVRLVPMTTTQGKPPLTNGHSSAIPNGSTAQDYTRKISPPNVKQNGGIRSYEYSHHGERLPVEVEYSNNITYSGMNKMPSLKEGKSSETEIH